MKYTWTQPYNPPGRFNRLLLAQRTIQSHEDLIKLDRLEPIEDVNQAQEILQKFTLGGHSGN